MKCVVSWFFGVSMKTGVMPLMQVFVALWVGLQSDDSATPELL